MKNPFVYSILIIEFLSPSKKLIFFFYFLETVEIRSFHFLFTNLYTSTVKWLALCGVDYI